MHISLQLSFVWWGILYPITNIPIILGLGTSESQFKALEEAMDETSLRATPLIEHLKPLQPCLKKRKREVALSEKELKTLLDGEYGKKITDLTINAKVTFWNFSTDINNEEKKQLQIDAAFALANFSKEYWEKYFKHLEPGDYDDEILKRHVILLKHIGVAALDADDFKELSDVIATMKKIYSKAKICPYDKKDGCEEDEKLNFTPGNAPYFTESSDYDELLYIWARWRDETGVKIRDYYKKYVELSNKAAVANGYKDKGEMWRAIYENENFLENIHALWKQVEPLYLEIHKFVGNKLKGKFGDKLDISDGLIPAHVLGNMFADKWMDLTPIVTPNPDVSHVDVTKALQDDGYTVLKMFETAKEFYTSLGLEDTSMCYGDDAMIEKPADRDVMCHPVAWDNYDQKIYRIRMCAKVNYMNFNIIHHEMGHIQYMLLYKNQPITLRDGSNPAFHEAVADTIGLAAITNAHLKKIGVLKDYEDNEKASLNALMEMALRKVVFLPAGLIYDKWRWDVFSGRVNESEWNDHWWKYRREYQRVKPPIERKATDFDPGAKFHLAADSQYISYFQSHILQFQFYRAMCIAAGQYDPLKKEEKPLHKCNFYQSVEAGDKLRAGLSLGRSKNWTVILKAITDEENIDASAMLEYFDPLYVYLQDANGAFSVMKASMIFPILVLICLVLFTIS